MKKVVIITGGSKGLGAGMVKAYLKHDYKVISIARTIQENFSSDILQLKGDLADLNNLSKLIESIFNLIDEKEIHQITLINNAAALGKVGRIENDNADSITQTINLNVSSPLIITSLFIQKIQSWTCKKKIINISSGAGLRPFPGWTTYCTSKAALNMMTQTIALDQEDLDNPVKIIAIGPGIIDTNMQAEIRAVDEADFKLKDNFIAYKNSGALANPENVGEEIYQIDQKEDYANGAILSVNDYR